MDTNDPNITSNQEFSGILRLLLIDKQRIRSNVLIPTGLVPQKIKTKEESMIEATFESCTFKTLMSCVLGKCDASIVLNLSKKTYTTLFR